MHGKGSGCRGSIVVYILHREGGGDIANLGATFVVKTRDITSNTSKFENKQIH